DYTAIHVANLSNTFKAKILGLKGWNAKFNNGTTDYIGVGVAKISELLTTFDIEQPAPIVIGE
ncbi:MAG: hypothetical protein NTV34_11665, partial [Proteobacteria bacterium]|nr:hypothetical protein [Pseudomonadota bacterium]